jgi:uncharacterized repeat protein (TIGR01451 family)
LTGKIELTPILSRAAACLSLLAFFSCGDPVSLDPIVTPGLSPALGLGNQDGELDAGGAFQSGREGFAVGETVVYRIEVINESQFTATGVVVVDGVAPNTAAISCTRLLVTSPEGGGANPSTGVVGGGDCTTTGFRWTIGDMPANTNAVLFFHADALGPGTTINRATLRADNLPFALVVEEQLAIDGGREMGINQADGEAGDRFFQSRDNFAVGEAIIYRVEVINTGVFTATGVTVVDVVAPRTGAVQCRGLLATSLDGGLANPSVGTVGGGDCSATGFTWTISTMPANTNAVLFFRAEATRSGSAINRVTLTTDQTTPVTVEELTTVVVQ